MILFLYNLSTFQTLTRTLGMTWVMDKSAGKCHKSLYLMVNTLVSYGFPIEFPFVQSIHDA